MINDYNYLSMTNSRKYDGVNTLEFECIHSMAWQTTSCKLSTNKKTCKKKRCLLTRYVVLVSCEAMLPCLAICQVMIQRGNTAKNTIDYDAFCSSKGGFTPTVLIPLHLNKNWITKINEKNIQNTEKWSHINELHSRYHDDLWK